MPRSTPTARAPASGPRAARRRPRRLRASSRSPPSCSLLLPRRAHACPDHSRPAAIAPTLCRAPRLVLARTRFACCASSSRPVAPGCVSMRSPCRRLVRGLTGLGARHGSPPPVRPTATLYRARTGGRSLQARPSGAGPAPAAQPPARDETRRMFRPRRMFGRSAVRNNASGPASRLDRPRRTGGERADFGSHGHGASSRSRTTWRRSMW